MKNMEKIQPLIQLIQLFDLCYSQAQKSQAK